MKNKITNLVIFLLIAAAVFQTGELWLGNTYSHNFFYSLFTSARRNSGTTDDIYEIIEPEKTVVGYGNKKFNMLYSNSENNSIINLSEQIIKDALINGKYSSLAELNWSEYIEGKAVILEYPFVVSAKEYIKGYAVTNDEFTQNVKNLNYIVVVPSGGNGETTSCYFIDETTSEVCVLTVNSSEQSAALYNAIQTMQYSDNESIEYISTVQSGLNIFGSIYVPQWNDGSYEYKLLEKTNSFEKDGATDVSVIETNANNFLGNYIAASEINDVNGIYTISSDDLVVKYYENGVLEYYNYDVDGSSAGQTLAEAYTISSEFIKKDTGITNDLYLSGAETRSDGLVFYYDYAVDNIPIVISEKTAEETGMSHAVEVVVSNKNVKRYKRITYKYSLNDEYTDEMNIDIISAWDNAIMNYTGNDTITSINDMYIGYYDDDSDKLGIYWFTELNNKLIVGDTYK